MAAAEGLRPKVSRTNPGLPAGPAGQGGPEISKGWPGDFCPPPHSRSVPGYGRDPVGNGHAAAGLSAVLAP